MALNFLQGRGSANDEDTSSDTPESNDEPSATSSRRSPTRRGSRGGRSSSARSAEPDARDDAEPAPRTRRRPAARADDDEETPAPRTRRRPAAKANDSDDEPTERPTPRRRSRAATADSGDGNAALLAALQEQNEKLSRLIELQERSGASGGSASGVTAATLPRVGIFVDSANVELARDRSGRRVDWGIVLERLTEGRRLVRAIAYSPVHDDPGVSRETQRFVEPFLRKGYKIVTKPLKRFADGTIKANVDIELALDLLTMSDRLDIAVLISGDGDFTHLVEVVQGKGVRVEVAGVGSSVASTLRNAADRYVELDFALK